MAGQAVAHWPKTVFKTALLSATALVSVGAGARAADYTIDGGTAETVIGGGGGTHASPWNVGGDLTVGDTGTGTLTISDSADVDSNDLILGNTANGVGTVTITDAGTAFDASEDIVSGYNGTGYFYVQNGAQANGDYVLSGANAGSNGYIEVTGSNSTLTAQSTMFIGYNGTGTLVVENGGTVDLNNSNSLVFGSQSGSNGTGSVSGSNTTITVDNDLVVADEGTGTLTISDGASVTVNDEGYVGYSSTGVGTLTVTGSGSLSLDTDLNIGRDGTGTLTLSDGGTIDVGDDLRIGRGSTGSGHATITGSGTSMTVADQVSVGYDGTGTLILSDGASMTSDWVYVGDQAGSSGTLTVTGSGTTWTNDEDFIVGYRGSGQATISDGASVTADELVLGAFSGSDGLLTITGSGTTFSTGGDAYVGNEGTGTLILSDGGLLDINSGSGDLNLAPDASTSGTLVIGSDLSSSPTMPGTLSAGTVDTGPGAATIIFNHSAENADNYVFSANITGSGTINSYSGYTILTGTLDHTGGTYIYGGVLSFNTTIGEVFLSGGTVGGNGTITTLTVTKASTIAPGNSIGTLTVTNDLSLPSGSTYAVEVDNAGNSDLLLVGGSFTLAGEATLDISPEDSTEDGSDYGWSTTYTILTADGGTSGEFSSVTDSFAYLDPYVTYDGTNIYLTLIRNNNPFSSAADTPNQARSGLRVESLGTGNALYQTLATYSESAAMEALDYMSGEIHGSARSLAMDDSRFARDMALGRLRQALDRPATGEADVQLWAEAYGAWGTWNGGDGAAQVRRSLGGFFAGADWAATPDWRVGLMTGYGRVDATADDRESTFEANVAHLGAYGGTDLGPVEVRLGAAYALQSVATERNIPLADFADTHEADYLIGTAQVFGEVARTFTQDNGLAGGLTHHQPFLRLSNVTTHSTGFTESGGDTALEGQASAQNITFTQLGLASDTALTFGDTSLTARGKVAWRHAFGGNQGQSELSLEGGDSVAINGVALSRDAMILEAGLDMALSDRSALTLAYSGMVGTGGQGHALKLSFSAKF